jgi:hypothetical protein
MIDQAMLDPEDNDEEIYGLTLGQINALIAGQVSKWMKVSFIIDSSQVPMTYAELMQSSLPYTGFFEPGMSI